MRVLVEVHRMKSEAPWMLSARPRMPAGAAVAGPAHADPYAVEDEVDLSQPIRAPHQ